MPEDKKAKKATRRLLDIDVDEVSVVDNPAIEETFIVIKNAERKAVWSGAFVNDLPDSSFLWIAPGGKKDGEGKTVPRSLRKFPYKDANGKIDLPHLRNAIARIPQASHPDLSQQTKERLQNKARRLLEQNTKKNAEIAMGPNIKAAMEAKGMTLEQLAEATAIALEKLKTVVEGTESLSEEELGKVATALDVEKFDDPTEKEDGQPAGASEKQEEDEGMEGETPPEGDPKAQMLYEKLNALVGLTSEVAQILADMGALQQKAEEQKPAEETKPEGSSEQTSEHLNPESSVNKAIEELTAALTKIKDSLAQKGERKKVEKAAEKEPPQQIDITKHPDVIEMRKQIGELTKKLEGFEKSGITKSLSDDDAAPTSVKKQEDKLEWSFFGDDFKE